MGNKFPFQGITEEFKKLRRVLPKIITEVAINDFQDNYKRQGHRGPNGQIIKWAKRQPSRESSGRAILVGQGSGRMKRSYHNRATSKMARAVNTAPYSEAHNKGLRMKGKQRVFGGITKGGNPRFKRTNKAAYMPKRPHMLTTIPLLNDIEKVALAEIETMYQKL